MSTGFQNYASKFLDVHSTLIAPHAFERQGNGVLTTDSVENGTLLISIPRDRLLSTNTVISHPILGKIVKKSLNDTIGGPLTALEALSLGILFFKFNPSDSEFWTLYLETLPTEYDSLIFWPEEYLKRLGSQETADRVRRRNSKIVALFEHTRAVFQKHMDSNNPLEAKFLAHLTLDWFRWAYGTIMSRSVFVRASTFWSSDIVLQKDNAALPPLLDFFNHSNETECEAGYSAATQCYELRTKQNFAKNSQLFIKYGCHSNATLLMHYGFAIPDNVYDAIPLKLDFYQLIGQTSHSESKFTKLNAYGLIDAPSLNKSSQSVKHVLSMDGLSWNTMVALKTMLITTPEEISDWDRLLEDVPISEANEQAYRQYCRSLYEGMLHQLDSAEAEATNMEKSIWDLSAEVFRRGWRAILVRALAELDS